MAEGSNDGKGGGADGLGTVSRDESLRQLAGKLAQLEAEVSQACPPESVPAGGGNKLGVRKHASFRAICTAPSINWTPVGSTQVPVPYQTVQDLSNSISTARTVRFNGEAAYLLDQTKQPKGTGDERGTGKGIRSGTVTGEVKPVSGCKTVRIEGKEVVREGDKGTMNGGNNPGVYLVQASSHSNSGFIATTKTQLRAAIKHPIEAAKGFVKSVANGPPEIAELVLRASLQAHADEQVNNSFVFGNFGQRQAADTTRDIAEAQRKIGDEFEVPKFILGNPAQEGGEKVGLSVQLLLAGAGLLKVAPKLAKNAVTPTVRATNGVRIVGTSGRVATRPNEAFFWSGRTNGIGGQEVAAELAAQKEGTTLEMLIEKNKIEMPPWDPNDPAAIKAWEDISAEYATGASGRVRAIIGQSLRPGNVWETKELPRLLQNPNVTEIVTIDPVSHVEKTIFKR